MQVISEGFLETLKTDYLHEGLKRDMQYMKAGMPQLKRRKNL